MKVLFVSSGNSKEGLSPIIKNQADSLTSQGVKLNLFTINEKGFLGYVKTIPKLRKYLKKNQYDLIHAHYSLSAYVASLAGSNPLVVSLMGSDVREVWYNRAVIKFFSLFFWSKTIVKSRDMQNTLGLKNAIVVPNGVDLKKFRPIDRIRAIEDTGWDKSKRHILFAANPNRPEKNFKIAKKAFDLLNREDTELHFLNDVSNDKMINHYNASDVVLLTSLWEGSPNVIKEAMACNVPIVSTNVGDIGEMIGKTKGCYLAKNDPEDILLKIEKSLAFNEKTDGRKSIEYLESNIIAERIFKIYNSILKQDL